MVLLTIAQAVFGVVRFFIDGQKSGPFTFAFGTVGLFLAAVLYVIAMYGLTVREKLAIRLPKLKQLTFVVLLTTPLVVVVSEIGACLLEICRRVGIPDWIMAPQDLINVIDAVRQYNPWLAAAGFVVFGGIMPGLGEELFFRGFVGRGLLARWGIVGGILLTSLLFAAMHVFLVQAAAAFLLGLLLHAVYLWTRSLIAPIVLHAVYNSQVFLASEMTRNTAHDLAADDHVPPVLALLSVIAAIGLVYLLYRSRVRWVRTDGADWSPGFPTAETPLAQAETQLVGSRLGAGPVAVVAVVYLLFIADLVWEIVR
ncbi:CPBP family intramembrane glutamic endopeptidase [Fimbriiglobus ruber]|uniref:Putative metal-dependent membrane protease n=1 Tax=Fimbriiglobus ruber TaxID=1908690 RepID=A0A225CZQ6_9BACT|nr:CPBP family intramembrane glutamic endopeptidase [Fimbriiglobus ruber]OWK34821.1 putative metal-dependent membrane protease [Fimbriiglobus ruber]